MIYDTRKASGEERLRQARTAPIDHDIQIQVPQLDLRRWALRIDSKCIALSSSSSVAY
ncbi:hypothetical protein TRIATDRAFT_297286 [Trichoderma atroviride IMI 206040]|uniref:Uncharacterized protein n=1 Tax=Hypocrea atroviridis (strain ATCC 20476 / IMI 206040) TaxID=452589 RepID=G9NGY4_HYPAI|nr:uncharacterized protein TRIATDRAFT_297286 [Trichoderma atroviride IMI 206040]EHK49882.1 hypothetical protein TRIATDRAFT_297286 [Trichoderma atroviride IMI 206040]